MKIWKKNSALLLTLIILTTVAIAQQIAFVANQFGAIFNKDQRSIGNYIFNLIKTKQLSLWPIAQLVFAQLLLYTAATAIIYFISIAISKLFKLRQGNGYLLGIILWFISAIFVAIANSYFFSHSEFSLALSPLLQQIILYASATILSAALLLAIFSWAKQIVKQKHYIFGAILLVLIITIGCSYYFWLQPSPKFSGSSATRPNIIIIGLDSIRPDHTSYYGNKLVITPNIDHFLATATNFTQAYSSLARTYVAWNSILSGQYPIHDQVRANLIDPKYLHLSHTLAAKLRRNGYDTIFATDSRQFSLINRKFGFQKIISPKMGIYDFIFSLFNDFPLSNLAMNSIIGEYLFPYNYANRMSYITYHPKTFDKFLSRKLRAKRNRPLFLGMHLILTHWPFLWANDNLPSKLSFAQHYDATIMAIDKQFADILVTLKKHGLLKHAIVILLSDHGLGLGLPGDRIIRQNSYLGNKSLLHLLTRYPYDKSILRPGMPLLGVDTAVGEGTDVLAYHTGNRIIFGIKTYGLSYGKQHRNIHYPVSLIDIEPTILSALKFPIAKKTDGISLLPFITNNPKQLSRKRTLFFETGIWIPLFTLNDLKHGTATKYIVKKLQTLFSFDSKNNLVVIKPKTVKRLLKTKQRAVLYGDWFLAKYPAGQNIVTTIIPTTKVAKQHCDFQQTYSIDQTLCYLFTTAKHPFYVLANNKTHQWTMDMNSSFAQQAPTTLLLNKLKMFYGKQIDN